MTILAHRKPKDERRLDRQESFSKTKKPIRKVTFPILRKIAIVAVVMASVPLLLSMGTRRK